MEVRVALRRVIDFLAGIDRPGGDLRHHQLALAGDLVHLFTPGSARVVTLTMRASRSSLEIPECVGEGGFCVRVRPFAGMTRIRFKGWRRGFSAISAGCRRPPSERTQSATGRRKRQAQPD